MTKAELIDRISRNRDLPPELTKKLIAEVLDVAFEELALYFTRTKLTRSTTPRFTFPGFGTFTKKRRQSRRGVNPRTLEPMEIEGYETLDFKPGTDLRSRLNGEGGGRRGSSTRRAKTTKTRARSASASKAGTRSGKGTKRGKTGTKKTGNSGLGARVGRGLPTREEAELEYVEPESVQAMLELPDAPMQSVSRRRRNKRDRSA